jgi:DNA ligase-1
MFVHEILAALKATSSRTDKLNILKDNSGHGVLKDVFLYAYDPRRKYFLTKVDNIHAPGNNVLSSQLIKEIFEPLANREVTGKAAQQHFIDTTADLTQAHYDIAVAILERDLDVGCTVSSMNKVWKDIIYVQPYMRCSLPSEVNLDCLDWDNGIIIQLKEDGMWSEVSAYYVTSRAGNQFYDEYTKAIQTEAVNKGLGNRKLNGEFLIEKAGIILPRTEGNGIINSISQDGKLEDDEKLIYSVWDITTGVGDKKVYEDRLAELKEFVSGMTSIRLIESDVVYSKDDAWVFYRKQLAKNKEGAVIKTKTGLYKDGTSKDQIKLKITAELDLKIVGFNPGKGKFKATFGSIQLESSDGKLACSVSGIKDKLRKEIHERREELLGTIVTIKSNGIMYNDDINSLFLCRFAELRTDKTEADSMEQIEAIFASLIEG